MSNKCLTKRNSVDTGKAWCPCASWGAGWGNFCCSWPFYRRDTRTSDPVARGSCGGTWGCGWWRRQRHTTRTWTPWGRCAVWRGSPATGSSSSSCRTGDTRSHLHLVDDLFVENFQIMPCCIVRLPAWIVLLWASCSARVVKRWSQYLQLYGSGLSSVGCRFWWYCKWFLYLKRMPHNSHVYLSNFSWSPCTFRLCVVTYCKKSEFRFSFLHCNIS